MFSLQPMVTCDPCDSLDTPRCKFLLEVAAAFDTDTGKPSMFGTSNKTNEYLCQFLLFILYTLIPVKFTKWIHLQQQQQPALLQKKVKILQYNILIQKKVTFTHLERTFM